MRRPVGITLLVLQAGLIMFCLYFILDGLLTEYRSEWLTSTAYVPYLILVALFYGLCMFLTSAVMRNGWRYSWIGLLGIAIFTVLPYATLMYDVRTGPPGW